MGDAKKETPAALDISSLDTQVLLELFIDILSIKAWQEMGLRVKPGTDRVEKDLGRAKLAIDCIDLLIDKLEPYVKDDEKSKLRSLLTDLRINFAKLA